ncbi:MAG: tRNA (adenine-N1)-methyltransferase [Theionarchaea archaeon]|nr:tRNA (adenine-N1)-methyltransferase [Theionarchaea archaeon]MBU7001711.1 tRNA (adenine-N1)-methyltransferase [Theionarchaea archaeon]MBU7021177.1 tRNA (adenine-N1)-methyltransferase [Theionarchaea archaeon]MBU7034552.1 tRNA (adenine-N1)-methyltransferase [Theionarchaea archaeon]MBU7040158.1 tRNA (adenine-N1)-methyltransferase [Theionarchaea archaeon]
MTGIAVGDLVLLVHEKKTFLVTVSEREFHTHFGVVDLKDLVGKEYGTGVESHSGQFFAALKPTYIDYIKKMRKMPQVIQPKDAAQILAHTGLSAGDTVVEGGAGSGALTVFLAAVVNPGVVYSYEVREDFLTVAQKNVELFGMKNVLFRIQDIYEGIDEHDVDLVTLDVPSPEKVVDPAYDALKIGGYIFSYSPCIEQVSRFCLATRQRRMQVKTIECIVREYEVSERGTRPKSRMLGHTGYMSFARKIC